MAEKKEFYTLLTNVGIAKFIAARASGNGVNLKTFKLSSKIIVPSESMNALEEVVYESLINSKYVDKENTHYVHLECVVPSNVGGFEINAIGIYDEAGDLLAVGNLPSTYKPLLEQGSAKELLIKVTMELRNASEVILELDPSVILASRDYVNEVKLELELKIDEAIQNFTEELKKYALKNGSTSEVFNVANAVKQTHAINKGELERALNLKADKTQVDYINNSLSDYVKTTGNQIVEGNKTFNGATTLNGTTNTKALNAGGKITAKSTLEVTGDAIFNGDFTANGAVDFRNLPACAIQATNDDQLVNLATLKKQVPLLGGGLGYGQTWQDVKTQRQSEVTYTNNTGKPIVVAMQVRLDVLYNEGFYVDDLLICCPRTAYGEASYYYEDFLVIVPPKSTYKWTKTESYIIYWLELR
ncbi:phage tail protein [Helicobacter sp. 14348-15]|uniref:phage tail protein n=1 Tax=Helicobacter colisuis TaxID=2949739 RepID=UPI00202B3AE1|nr:phage tail protein [Helicobacter colisuis]MCL9820930.1 phage tail protein [Helicobacter colisuis]